MKILVINPNTSAEMTRSIDEELRKIKRADTELVVVCPDKGPVTIESAYDEVLASPHVVDLVKKANDEDYDAIILACFSDPAIDACKEVSDILVAGIEEVTLHMAAMLGAKFTILTPMKRRIPVKHEEVAKYKLSGYLASVRELGMSVAETESNPILAKERILEVSRKAVDEDGAEILILGCAGMVGYAEEVERQLGIVVLDPASVTLKICEGMVDAGLKISKKALFSHPPAKKIL